jgi:hypothetical protein
MGLPEIFLGARSVTKPLRVDASTTEAMGALWAVQFSKEVGFFDVIFKGDATQIVSKINSGPPFLSRVGHFIESIHMEKQGFRSIAFIYTPRVSNSVAHILAKEAACNKVDNCWLEDIPRSISGIVFRESIFPISYLKLGSLSLID